MRTRKIPLLVPFLLVACSALLVAVFVIYARNVILFFTNWAHENGNSVAVDGNGNIVIMGEFSGVADFDPGPAVVQIASDGELSNFVSKFDSDGRFQWVKTWGDRLTQPADIDVDADDNIYATGIFFNSIDLGKGHYAESSNSWSVYVCKLKPDGNVVWVRSWKDNGGFLPSNLTIEDNRTIQILSYFEGTTDFDPGPTLDEHTAKGRLERYTSSFNPDGTFLGVETGQLTFETGSVLAFDTAGSMYAAGYFYRRLDEVLGLHYLGSDSGVVGPTSNQRSGLYIGKLNAAGVLLWVQTWGDIQFVGMGDLALDTSANIYIAGSFADTVDFDPGEGISERSSMRNSNILLRDLDIRDVFLVKLDSNGNFLWVRTWGESGWDRGDGVSLDENGSVYVTGEFHGSVDFDPGPEVERRRSTGNNDIFLSKYDSNGNFLWVLTWGGRNAVMEGSD